MALKGSPDTNVSSLKIGAARQEMLFNMGEPIKTKADSNKQTDYFKTSRGNQPSVGRAAFHIVMDLLTFGIWEVIGVPMEAMGSSSTTIQVDYEDEKVTNFKTVSQEEVL
jgi:hypothetical protein